MTLTQKTKQFVKDNSMFVFLALLLLTLMIGSVTIAIVDLRKNAARSKRCVQACFPISVAMCQEFYHPINDGKKIAVMCLDSRGSFIENE